MPRFVLVLALLAFTGINMLVASYWTPAAPILETTSPIVRPAVGLDPSVIVGPPKVKLAVLVVFDQMRGDYIVRWKSHFPPGGFRRLMDDGCWFSQCYYPYATTTTGPGHASILCGTTPAVTGIINNDWYDRSAGTMVEFASTGTLPANRQFHRSRAARLQSTTKKPKGSGTPERMIAASLGDSVKASGRDGKVIGISLKDRSAIFPAGHDPTLPTGSVASSSPRTITSTCSRRGCGNSINRNWPRVGTARPGTASAPTSITMCSSGRITVPARRIAPVWPHLSAPDHRRQAELYFQLFRCAHHLAIRQRSSLGLRESLHRRRATRPARAPICSPSASHRTISSATLTGPIRRKSSTRRFARTARWRICWRFSMIASAPANTWSWSPRITASARCRKSRTQEESRPVR